MRRALNLAGAVLCAALLGYALYAQFQLGLAPCPLCIFQRVGVAAVGVLFLLAALVPAGRAAQACGALIALAALATVGLALRHVWIQHLPAGTVPVCGASLQFLLHVFPLTDVIRKVLSGSGECAKVTWTLLGVSMPAWVALAAAALAALGLYANYARLPSSSLRMASR
jgi:disulfide bond formation protein DsbB